MDHNEVHLLTYPDPHSGINSDWPLEAIINITESTLIEFEPESVIPEICVETADVLGIADCAVVEFGDVPRTVRAMGWPSPLAAELTRSTAPRGPA
jgi:hypothetical protein